ncbi:MAG: HRDC domain-containing protein [Gemmatimonadaceae bacterium]|nr:HRDC domain-containing protein [Gemmatimonadaceae bacterium]
MTASKHSEPRKTLYLDSPDATDHFLSSIASTPVIAVDTEGASFHRYVDRIYLLQLSTATQHAIIDPLRVASPLGLGRLLESRDVEVVFHDADYDLRLLHQDYGWKVTNIFDTRVAAQLLGLKAFGLAALLDSFFGVKLDKKHQRADWSMRPLSADMLDYAAQDTLHLLELRQRLRDALEKKGRWHWALEEFARLEGTRWDTDDAGAAFLRMKGARDLTRRELALLKELVSWRDGVAKGLDRSSFRVVTNEVLLELSRKSPTAMDELRAIKGIGRSILEHKGGEMLDAVARGRAVPENDLPRFPKPARWDRDPTFDERVSRLKRVRDAVAADLDLDPGVLCARDRMEAVARRKPTDVAHMQEIPEMRRWQSEVLGAEFVKALRNAPMSDASVSDAAVTDASVSDTFVGDARGGNDPGRGERERGGAEARAASESPYRDA